MVVEVQSEGIWEETFNAYFQVMS